MRFVKGYIEFLSEAGIENNSIDIIISNCVVNLSPEKKHVLAGAYAALKEGHVSDVLIATKPSLLVLPVNNEHKTGTQVVNFISRMSTATDVCHCTFKSTKFSGESALLVQCTLKVSGLERSSNKPFAVTPTAPTTHSISFQTSNEPVLKWASKIRENYPGEKLSSIMKNWSNCWATPNFIRLVSDCSSCHNLRVCVKITGRWRSTKVLFLSMHTHTRLIITRSSRLIRQDFRLLLDKCRLWSESHLFCYLIFLCCSVFFLNQHDRIPANISVW